jgi:hypothetical protein
MMGLDSPEKCRGWQNTLRISCASICFSLHDWFFLFILFTELPASPRECRLLGFSIVTKNDWLYSTERIYKLAACKSGAFSCHHHLILPFHQRHQQNKRVRLIRNYTVMSQQIVLFVIKFCCNCTLEASPPQTLIKPFIFDVLCVRPLSDVKNLGSDDFAWFLISFLRKFWMILLTKEILKSTSRSRFRLCLWKITN